MWFYNRLCIQFWTCFGNDLSYADEVAGLDQSENILSLKAIGEVHYIFVCMHCSTNNLHHFNLIESFT